MTCSKDGRYRGSTARRESMNKLFSIPGISYTSSSVNLDTMGCFFNFLREFRQCNRQNPVFQACLDAVFFDPFHIELAAEDRAGTFTADVMTVIIFFPPSVPLSERTGTKFRFHKKYGSDPW